MNVVGYPQPGKRKSTAVLEAFCAGAGGGVVFAPHFMKVRPEPAAFYGTIGLEDLFRQARRRAEQGGAEYFYLDNAWFDCARQRYFRVCRNGLQAIGARPDFARLKQLGVEIAPWRSSGGHVLLVEQSDYFMRHVAGFRNGALSWRESAIRILRESTDREIRVRPWQRDKSKAATTLRQDLEGAWAVVTPASAAAIEAILAGIPAFVTDLSVALEMGSCNFASIENPRRPDGRAEWAARLAASQWTLDEMRAGKAWRALTEELDHV